MREQIKNPREIAYLALLVSLRNEGFVSDILRQWREETSPPSKDDHLAQEIANGSARMALTLDYLAQQVTPQKKLDVKLKERALLRTAVYQMCFMDRVPSYAVVDETIKIAHKYCHSTFVKFLNAILRRIAEQKPALPTGNSPVELSIRYSYPQFFTEKLLKSYGVEKTPLILEAGNTAAPHMVRLRDSNGVQNWELVKQPPFPVALIKETSRIPEIASSPSYYIQNVTPVELMTHLSGPTLNPHSILDLCASPGGKTLLAYDLYPNAQLFANDVSPKKLETLENNFHKYGIHAQLSCALGEEFKSEQTFDLIILDVPCSNSGVLNKRAEARWRLTPESLLQLEETQLRLLKHALTLLSPEGEIWYLTCSILPDENEALMGKACELFGLTMRSQKTILPNFHGWDGGYCCKLQRTSS